MTIVVFLVSLLGAMALGMPIAFSLIVCALKLYPSYVRPPRRSVVTYSTDARMPQASRVVCSIDRPSRWSCRSSVIVMVHSANGRVHRACKPRSR